MLLDCRVGNPKSLPEVGTKTLPAPNGLLFDTLPLLRTGHFSSSWVNSEGCPSMQRNLAICFVIGNVTAAQIF